MEEFTDAISSTVGLTHSGGHVFRLSSVPLFHNCFLGKTTIVKYDIPNINHSSRSSVNSVAVLSRLFRAITCLWPYSSSSTKKMNLHKITPFTNIRSLISTHHCCRQGEEINIVLVGLLHFRNPQSHGRPRSGLNVTLELDTKSVFVS